LWNSSKFVQSLMGNLNNVDFVPAVGRILL